MEPVIDRLARLRPQINEIAATFGVSRISVFGSVARGTENPDSDLDLLIKLDRKRTLLDQVGFEQAMEDLLHMPVDVITEGGVHPLLEPAIRREARPL